MADNKPNSPLDPTQDSPIVARDDERTLSVGAFRELPLQERVRSINASFLTNTILANRFQVVRFIARGGMGEVYEAEDLVLKERVAVKCIRFEYAQHENATERFKREIQLARKVTHPGVCRTYDVFRHSETIEGEDGHEILVVSMELLDGKTLSDEIRDKGKLTTEEALPIVMQMAAGLGAAHEAGVVHRDFKSANVLLVPSERSPGIVRAVITDFGLARSTEGGRQLTGSLDVVGTPAYMAPEQLNGGEITPATDIYALGIVMYEVLTGKVPYSGDTAIGMAMRRLSEDAPSPRESLPGLNLTWESTILHCLEREPKDRFQSTDEIVKVLGGEMKAPPKKKLKRGEIAPKWWLAAGALAVILLIAGSWFALRKNIPTEEAGPSATVQSESKARPSVAVLGFQNLSELPNTGLLGEMLADGLWSQLDTDEIRFIPPGRVDEMRNNLGIKEATGSLDKKQLGQIKEYLGSDVVITGTYRVKEEAGAHKIDWNIHLLSTDQDKGLGSLQTSGTEADLGVMVGRAGKMIRSKLGVELSVTEEARLDNSMSSSSEALKYFSEAREKRRKFDMQGSIKSLERAVQADPQFAQAHLSLAEAWSALGYEAKAEEEAQKAMELSKDLPAEARGLVSGRFYEMTHNWPKAMESYASLRTLFGDDPQFGLLLARSQTSAGKGQAALGTLDQVQQKNLPKGVEAEMYLARSEAQESLGNYRGQLEAASAASQKAAALTSNLLLARARIQECWALINLGETQKAKPLCEEARKLNMDAGDQLGAARATNVVANAAYQQGDLEEAKKLYEQALNVSQMIGDKIDESGALNNLANILDDQGNHDAAITTYRKSIEIARERDDKSGLSLAQQNLGVALFESGDSKAGSGMLLAAIQTSRALGDKSTEATVLNNLCMFSLEAGDPKKALENCEGSLRLRKEIDSKSDQAKTLVSRGSVFMAQGNLGAARKDYEEGLQLQETLGQKADAAYTRIAFSKLALSEKKYSEAKKLAGDAAMELAVEKDANGEAEARSVLAEAEVGLKNLTAAQSEMAQVMKLTEKSTEKKTRLSVELAKAQVESEMGKSQEAIADFQRIEVEARKAGLIALALDARLALGAAQVKNGKAVQGKRNLDELQREAKGRGFVLVAEQAASVR